LPILQVFAISAESDYQPPDLKGFGSSTLKSSLPSLCSSMAFKCHVETDYQCPDLKGFGGSIVNYAFPSLRFVNGICLDSLAGSNNFFLLLLD